MSRPQAIAGVSCRVERTVAVTYPSISAGAIGKAMGLLFESIPIGIGTIKLSYLLFCLPLAPLGALLYLLRKAFGQTYEVTNRSVRVWSMVLGTRSALRTEVPLANLAEVAVDQSGGQVFFNAADLHLLDAKDGTLAVLEGVVHAGSFRQTILKAARARSWTDSALSTIQARQPA